MVIVVLSGECGEGVVVVVVPLKLSVFCSHTNGRELVNSLSLGL